MILRCVVGLMRGRDFFVSFDRRDEKLVATSTVCQEMNPLAKEIHANNML